MMTVAMRMLADGSTQHQRVTDPTQETLAGTVAPHGDRFVYTKGEWHYENYIGFASLAEGLREHGVISEAAIQRGETQLRNHRIRLQSILEQTAALQPHTPSGTPSSTPSFTPSFTLKATATSALREAKNSSIVCARLEAALEAPIEIISSQREAELTFLGASMSQNFISPSINPSTQQENPKHPPNQTSSTNKLHSKRQPPSSPPALPTSATPIMVIDIGGGSTELGWGVIEEGVGRFAGHQGFLIGAVSWKDRYSHAELMASAKRIELRKALLDHIEEQASMVGQKHIPDAYRKGALIGVAGAPTTLAALHYGVRLDEVEGNILHERDILAWEEKLAMTPLATLIKDTVTWAALNEARAGIMVFSCIALRAFMKYVSTDTLRVSVLGLRYGTLHELQTQGGFNPNQPS